MNKIIVLNGEFLGKGDNELGKKLMGSFLRKLSVEENKPKKIIFLNSAVKLLSKKSTVLDAIDLLNQAGIVMVACGTCAQHYNIIEEIEPEWISNMSTVISLMMNSDDVITM